MQTGSDVFQVPKVEWRTVAFSPDSRLIYAAEDEVNNVAVWDIANNSRQGTINHHQTTIIQVAVSCDGRYVVSLANNGSFIIRDTKENHQTNLRTGLRGRIETFALGPFGRSLLTVDTNGVVRVCNLPTGQVVCDLATIVGKSPLPILHLSANGKFLALVNERELCISDLLPATDSDDMPSYDTP